KEEAIFPTPIIGVAGLHESCKHVPPRTFQDAGNLIYVLGEPEAAYGGRELQNIVRATYTGNAPALDLQVEAKRQTQLINAIQQGVVQAAHDIAEGGLAVALTESVFNEKGLGLEVDITMDPTVALFSESQSRFIVTVKQENREKFETLVANVERIGHVTADNQLTIKANNANIIQEDTSTLGKLWRESIANLLKSQE